MELYCYYDAVFTPAVEAGHWFFDDWTKTEWDKFYNFMFHCIQEFLTHGLTEYDSKTLKIKKITKSINIAGYEYLHEKNTKTNSKHTT